MVMAAAIRRLCSIGSTSRLYQFVTNNNENCFNVSKTNSRNNTLHVNDNTLSFTAFNMGLLKPQLNRLDG